MSKVSEHFSDWELISPKLKEAIVGLPIEWFLNTDALEDIRTHFNKPVICNVNSFMVEKYGFTEPMFRRGICTDQENIDAGRKISSQHRLSAFDITVIGVSPVDVGAYIEVIANMYNIGGMGVNEIKNFTHLDWRSSKELIKWTY